MEKNQEAQNYVKITVLDYYYFFFESIEKFIYNDTKSILKMLSRF